MQSGKSCIERAPEVGCGGRGRDDTEGKAKVNIMDHKRCDWPECAAEAGPAHSIHGSAYCPEHYRPALERDFFREYDAWTGKQPTRKFLNLFARYVQSLKRNPMPGGLTKGKLNERTYDFKKTEEGLEFSIVRHPYAFSVSKPTEEVAQRWHFTIKEKMLELLNEDWIS